MKTNYKNYITVLCTMSLLLAACGSKTDTTGAQNAANDNEDVVESVVDMEDKGMEQDNSSREDTMENNTADVTNTPKAEEKQEEYTFRVEELIIKNAAGDDIYGKIYLPDSVTDCPAVILSHGYNGIHADFTAECKYFASKGYIAYAYDFRGGSARSRSTGASTDMTIFTEKEDLLTVFEYISGMEQVDKDNLFLFGGSQGGLVTALAAEECGSEVKGVILYYPALNIPDDWRKTYATVEEIPETNDFWGLKLGRNFFTSIHDFYTFDNIGTFNKNVLIIHGDKDTIVSLKNSERAVELYPHAELIVLPGEGHGYTPKGAKTAMEHTLKFMDGQIQ